MSTRARKRRRMTSALVPVWPLISTFLTDVEVSTASRASRDLSHRRRVTIETRREIQAIFAAYAWPSDFKFVSTSGLAFDVNWGYPRAMLRISQNRVSIRYATKRYGKSHLLSFPLVDAIPSLDQLYDICDYIRRETRHFYTYKHAREFVATTK